VNTYCRFIEFHPIPCVLCNCREKSKALKMERDKLEQLVMVMKASRAEVSTAYFSVLCEI